MKSLLPYFVEFQDNGTILSKEYTEDFVIKRPNRQLIIMIICGKSIFLVNNSYSKIWILKEYRILWPKKRSKGIIILLL